MKAIVCESFGPLEELQFKDVADPQVKKGELSRRTIGARSVSNAARLPVYSWQ